MFDLLITGGRVVDGTGTPWYRADVGIKDGRITAVGPLARSEAAVRIEAKDKVVSPGFIDTHVHGDLALLADKAHEPAVRQGVTTYIIGQDGVAMAPASPKTLDYMRRYTAGFSGPFELKEQWVSVADYLACFDRRCAINVAYLIPNGNVRMEVMGLETRQPTADELKRMRRLVREGMEQGAVGLSSGLDYIPSLYADTEELIALCSEISPFGGIYVTHMRNYLEKVIESMDEVYRIGREAGCGVHISHFNSKADIVIPKLDDGRAKGVDVTFDLYCYMAGSSILGMVVLPPWVQAGGIDPTMARLRDPATRDKLREWFKAPRIALDTIRLSFIADPKYRQYEGVALEAAAKDAKKDPGEFACDLLVSSGMAVGCVVQHTHRTQDDVRALMRHPGMMGGSDGIFTGNCPHPRGCGCFARYLGHHVRDDHTWTLEEAVRHLAAIPAKRFGLQDRGLIGVGMAADVVVFDPDKITDRSTYDEGRKLAEGVDHVVVNGELVLHQGRRTPATPGRPLKH
jgi:N-acyl-D-amino-acid deacylase